MQQNSFVFAFEHGEDCFIGATPERLVKVEGDALLSTCLAGTAPRGKTELEDRVISTDLLNDHKNREEIGRASCRGRELIGGVGGARNKSGREACKLSYGACQ